MFSKSQLIKIFAMHCFTPNQLAQVVMMNIKNSPSVVVTQRAYRLQYHGQEAPYENSIRSLILNFDKIWKMLQIGQIFS